MCLRVRGAFRPAASPTSGLKLTTSPHRGVSVRSARDVARVGHVKAPLSKPSFQAGKDMDGVPGDVPGSGVGSLGIHEDVES